MVHSYMGISKISRKQDKKNMISKMLVGIWNNSFENNLTCMSEDK